MTFAQKSLLILGSIFTGLGTLCAILFFTMNTILHASPLFVLFPFVFVVIGLGFIIGVLVSVRKKTNIQKYGVRYPAKIYNYVKNTSYMVNGRYPVNTVVHYFDNYHVEREAVLPTSFCQGSSMYPIGMTIDIFEYRGKYSYDPASVRYEILPGEQELMDNKPINPAEVQMVAVTCPYCGASFKKAAGYVEKCPYCGSYQNT